MQTMPRLILVFLFLILASCSTKFFGSEPDSADQDDTPVSPVDSATFYQDFDDILVPKDMELQTGSSFIFETPQVKAGLLVFKGRVDAVSLATFFENNMHKDGWARSSSFKYQRAIMVFTKPDRDCIINIIEHRFSTLLEIWVAPKSEHAVSDVPSEFSLTN
jgi:hypothetical protein